MNWRTRFTNPTEAKRLALAADLWSLYGEAGECPQGISLLRHRAGLALKDGVITEAEFALVVG